MLDPARHMFIQRFINVCKLNPPGTNVDLFAHAYQFQQTLLQINDDQGILRVMPNKIIFFQETANHPNQIPGELSYDITPEEYEQCRTAFLNPNQI